MLPQGQSQGHPGPKDGQLPGAGRLELGRWVGPLGGLRRSQGQSQGTGSPQVGSGRKVPGARAPGVPHPVSAPAPALQGDPSPTSARFGTWASGTLSLPLTPGGMENTREGLMASSSPRTGATPSTELEEGVLRWSAQTREGQIHT